MFARGWVALVGGCLLIAGVLVLLVPSGSVEQTLGSRFSALPAFARDAQGDCGERLARSRERAAMVSRSDESALRIAVLGDSYAVGTGLSDPADSWPTYLPGEVYVDGFGGSGFSASAGSCRGVAYGDRLGAVLGSAPGLVVIQGGLNDWRSPTTEIEEALARLLEQAADTPILIVGPASAPRRLEEVARVDAALATVAGAYDVGYVSAAAWRLDYLADRLHLTEAGHRVFGEAVAAAIRDRGLLGLTATAAGPPTR